MAYDFNTFNFEAMHFHLLTTMPANAWFSSYGMHEKVWYFLQYELDAENAQFYNIDKIIQDALELGILRQNEHRQWGVTPLPAK